MSTWQRGIASVSGFALLVVLSIPGLALADPCLMVYSDNPVAYHYDPTEYFTVTDGHPLYDPVFERGGEVLIGTNTDEIPLNIYQTPNLIGFELDAENQGYFLVGTDFLGIVDGFNNQPTTYVNVLLVFDMVEPEFCVPTIIVDGNPALFEPGLGFYWPIGDLVVSTPTAEGNNFSDTMELGIQWEGCVGLRIYAFSDENFNLNRDGSECFSTFSHDLTVTGIRTAVLGDAELRQNYPNPFNPTTTIEFTLHREGHVDLVIFDASGTQVATLLSETLVPNKYAIPWTASDVASGVYFYRLQTGDFSATRKLVLLK